MKVIVLKTALSAILCISCTACTDRRGNDSTGSDKALAQKRVPVTVSPETAAKADCDFSQFHPLRGDWDAHHDYRNYMATPTYPQGAQLAGISGRVQVRVVVDSRGMVVKACAVNGAPELTIVSEEAAMKSTFAPLILNGEAVPYVEHTLRFSFELPKKVGERQ